MSREDLLKNKIIDEPPDEDLLKSMKKLVEYYDRIHGFMAGHIARAYKILRKARFECKLRFLSFTANIVASGIRGLLAKLIRDGHFNIVITTCGTVDHDIAKYISKGGYFKGYFESNDDFLSKINIHRLGNIYIPVENYGPLIEKFIEKLLNELEKKGLKRIEGYKLLWEAGRVINDKNSILRAAWETKTPVIIPGFYDGSFGTNLYMLARLKNINIDLMSDQKILEELVFENMNSKSMALIIGGGISKHHTIWWNQFKGGLDYTVYITTAVEYDGSLSGAHPREAVSWGKIKVGSEYVVVYGDATVILPILASAFY